MTANTSRLAAFTSPPLTNCHAVGVSSLIVHSLGIIPFTAPRCPFSIIATAAASTFLDAPPGHGWVFPTGTQSHQAAPSMPQSLPSLSYRLQEHITRGESIDFRKLLHTNFELQYTQVDPLVSMTCAGGE